MFETVAPAADQHEAEAWEPTDGVERTLYTVLANLVLGVAVSLMLLGAMVVKGDPIDARHGVLWGIGGFVAASLLPSLGLPPELPGSVAAEIASRQAWWLATAAASAVGIGLMVFGRAWPWRIAGLILLVVPHAVGAPEPPTHEAAYPVGLAGEFVIASLVLSFVLWSLSGLVAGWLHQRLARAG
jgi:cobalt transporter subunit CbtA